MQKGWKYSAVELDENEKLAWMPSGNKRRRLTWPVMRYRVRRRMRQLHFHPAFKQEGKIFWIQMLPSRTGNVIRGQSLGCWGFSMKFMPPKENWLLYRTKETLNRNASKECETLNLFHKKWRWKTVFCIFASWLMSFPPASFQKAFLLRTLKLSNYSS